MTLAALQDQAEAWRRIGRLAGIIARESSLGQRREALGSNVRALARLAAQLGIPLTAPLVENSQPELAVLAAQLTEREMQVLTGMSQGMSNGQIAQGLYITEDTVKTHARRMFKKIGARDRAHAVAKGFRHGLLRTEPGSSS